MSTKEAESGRALVPAYVAFKTFHNFVAGFSEGAGLPDHIDKSLMPTMAGGVRNHLMASLKFLGLVGDNGAATAEFSKLVKAYGTNRWKEQLRQLIDRAYDGIASSGELGKLTPKTLQDNFREAGATGSTTSRAVRFYMSALKECDVEIPTMLQKATADAPRKKSADSNGAPRKRSGNGRGERTRGKRGTADTEHETSESTPKGMIDFKVPFGDTDGLIRVPRAITTDQFEVFSAFIGVVEKLAKQNSGDSEK